MTIVFDLEIDYKLYSNDNRMEINLVPHIFFIDIKNNKYMNSDFIFNYRYTMTYEALFSYYNIDKHALLFYSYLSQLPDNKNIQNELRMIRDKYSYYLIENDLEDSNISFCNKPTFYNI